MFQYFVFNLKNLRKNTSITFLIFFINSMIRHIKIHNILNTIKISKYMEPNKCIHLKK